MESDNAGSVEGPVNDPVRGAQYPADDGSDTDLDRLLLFSDGVFAIAITILVLDLNVPEGLSHDALDEALREVLPNLGAAALSFAVIGRFWIAHHSIFSRIRRADHPLLVLNLMLLAPIVFLPFVTKLLADYFSTPEALIAYSATVALVAIAEIIIWGYATHRRRLVDERLHPRIVVASLARMISVAVAFLLAIPVALVAPEVAPFCWLLTALPTKAVLARSRYGRAEAHTR